MHTVDVIVDNWLRVDGNMLGHDLVEQIFDRLTIPNMARIEHEEHGRTWQAKQMSAEFYLAGFYDRDLYGDDPEFNGDWVVMARGFALELKKLCREHGRRVRWVDRRVWEPGEPYGYEEYRYREHQPAAVDAIKHHQQGIYRAPTGSGKTAVLCGFLWETHPQNALIYVDKVTLVDQWIEAINERIGLPVEDIGRIAEGKWSTGRITVATVQTIHRKWDEPRTQNLIRRQSVTVLDECHHATAWTFRAVLDSSASRIRLGMSATPDKTGEFALARYTLGPIFHWDDDEDMRDAGVILKPHVEVVHTPFNAPFWGDHAARRLKSGNVEECEVPGCRKSGKVPHTHRNNYQQVKKKLLADQKRNEIIATNIQDNFGQCQVIISNEINQLDSIWKTMHSLGIKYPYFYTLTGKTKKGLRDEMFEQMAVAPGFVLFSTVAGEGLDIPRINRIHLPFPTKNPRTVEQWIGRGTRIWEGKNDIIVYDYADVENPALAAQFRSRLTQCYYKLGLDVELDETYTQGVVRRANGGGLGSGILR